MAAMSIAGSAVTAHSNGCSMALMVGHADGYLVRHMAFNGHWDLLLNMYGYWSLYGYLNGVRHFALNWVGYLLYNWVGLWYGNLDGHGYGAVIWYRHRVVDWHLHGHIDALLYRVGHRFLYRYWVRLLNMVWNRAVYWYLDWHLHNLLNRIGLRYMYGYLNRNLNHLFNWVGLWYWHLDWYLDDLLHRIRCRNRHLHGHWSINMNRHLDMDCLLNWVGLRYMYGHFDHLANGHMDDLLHWVWLRVGHLHVVGNRLLNWVWNMTFNLVWDGHLTNQGGCMNIAGYFLDNTIAGSDNGTVTNGADA